MIRESGTIPLPPPLPSGPGVVHVVGAAVIERGLCLVARRKAGGSSGGKWEFPGGKVEKRETPTEALVREIEEEFGEAIIVGPWAGRGIARPDTRTIVLDVYLARAPNAWQGLVKEAHDEVRWVKAEMLEGFDWAEADLPIVPRVAGLLLSNESGPWMGAKGG